MKDVLSFLIRQNTAASAASSVSGVLAAWLPLVKKLAVANERSTAQQLTSMLFRAANDEFDLIDKNGIHKEEITVDTDTEMKADESGTLDKLPDNCLSHCLSFVHCRDVLLNVELSCRRLFHVSRARKSQRSVPFGGLRMDTHDFISKEEALEFADFYKDGITTLKCSETESELFSLTFSNLRTVDFCHTLFGTHISVPFNEFLSRQPNVDKCCFIRDLRQDPDFYRQLATVTQLTDVFVENKENDDGIGFGMAMTPPMVDMSHIRELTLDSIDSWALFHPFVHSQLTRLWLHFEGVVTAAPYFDIRLPNLVSLRLAMVNCLDIVQATLDRIHAPKLKELEMDCGFDAVPHCLCLCPKGDVTLDLWGKEEALQRVDVDKALEQLRTDRHMFALSKLRVIVNHFRNYVFVIRFVVGMALMFAPGIAVSIEIEPTKTTEQLEICRQFKDAGAEGLLHSGIVKNIDIDET